MPKSFLEVNGVYDPSRRFAFTNITEEPFTSHWDSRPITVPKGATVELPHHLAVKMTTELVDKIMMDEAKLDEVQKNEPFYRSPKGMSVGVPAARKPWEDKILRELALDEESPAVQVMRTQIREELMRDMSQKPASGPVVPPASMNEFAELGKEEPKPEPKPLKVNTL